MSVILSKGSNPRQTGKFTALFIAVAHSRVGVSLWKFTIAPSLAVVDLGVMRTIHRLHCKDMTFAGCDLEQFILELFPVPAFFIQIFFSDMRDFNALVSVLASKLPNIIIK